MSKLYDETVSIQLNSAAVNAVKGGHPWIFKKGIVKQNKQIETACTAVLYDQKRKYVGLGFFDAESPIKVRVLHRGTQTQLDEAWLKKKIKICMDNREALFNSTATNGFRVVHGENDKLGGLVVDKYDKTVVIKLYTIAWVKPLEIICNVINDLLKPDNIVLRLSRGVAKSESLDSELFDGKVLQGKVDDIVVFKENDILFAADPVNGQKTGFFLDQRDNRKRVEDLSRGKKVLNVFSYNGGFSLYAARGGASSVTSLDISQPALDASIKNFKLNYRNAKIDTCEHNIICADAFESMKQMKDDGEKFDVVIVDPPSFAKKAEEKQAAIKAYEKLTLLALDLLDEGGMLVSASCSARVSADEFFSSVKQAIIKSKKKTKETARTLHAIDHPIGFNEGAYLKCVYNKLV
jgi:23S rRNA (cytosine1962-C5)-methyltransferase